MQKILKIRLYTCLHTRLCTFLCISIVVTVLLAVGAGRALAVDVKKERTCGCAADDYAVYGAGGDTCATFLTEYDANPDKDNVDPAFAQTLGWIAGYVSAINRKTAMRDVFDMELDYMAKLLADWCQGNPQARLSDAMDALSDKREGSSGWFVSE